MKRMFAVVAALLLGLSMFASSAWAGYGGGFRSSYSSSSFRSYSAPRIYSTPRVYVAPRVYAAPRAVIVAPRPAYTYRRPAVIVRPPLIVSAGVPMGIQPGMQTVVPDVDVSGSYGQPAPVAAVPVQASPMSPFDVFLVIFVIILVLGGGGYSMWYFDPFDFWIDDYDLVVY